MKSFTSILLVTLFFVIASSETDPGSTEVLQSLRQKLSDPKALPWEGNDPCGAPWKYIQCRGSSVTGISLSLLGLQGTLPASLAKLSSLEYLGLQGNLFSGPMPSLAGLSKLKIAYLGDNLFSSIPAGFFSGLDSLTALYLDNNPINGTDGWSLPEEISLLGALSNLSLTNTSLVGTIPGFLGSMPQLRVLNLAYNRLSGGIPASFSDSNLVQLQANNMQGPVLTGPIDAIGKMSSLEELWLQVNEISGSIPPDLGNLIALRDLKLNDNKLTGPIPASLVNPPLETLSVENNQLVGPIPAFKSSVSFISSGNSFCTSKPGSGCSSEVSILLQFLGDLGYPNEIVSSWKGDDACDSWSGIVCNTAKRVSVIELPGSQLVGSLSPALANLTDLTTVLLGGNNISGPIPPAIAGLAKLLQLDLHNNNLSGDLPKFPERVKINLSGNPLLSQGGVNSSSGAAASASPSGASSAAPVPAGNFTQLNTTTGGMNVGSGTEKPHKKVKAGVVAGPIIGVVCLFLIGGGLVFFFLSYKRSQQRFVRVQSPTMMVHPRSSGSDADMVKIMVPANGNSNALLETTASVNPGGEVQVVEAGNLVISIQVLRSATRNFSEQTVLGKGGFGTVYRGQLDDGTNIAVKRMESSSCVVSSKGLSEFQAEIGVLSKVRHRHLVALLGYCIDGNEKLLVYEYLPQGALSHHLFEYRRMGLKPLDWKLRLGIALDVARGMEYLHGLAYKSFIHRDLKPSNVLLDDDMRAKVSDFGLVKLAPEGSHSVETKLAGTFGYLAPEYAVTGRVTTKADVFSFGVVLMELISGRRALDETQAEENMHLVTWFRRSSSSSSKESLIKVIDPVLGVPDVSSDLFPSIYTVAELGRHCTAREPYQRPDMGHAVSVLSPLVDEWKPSDQDVEESAGIDLSLTLPQALKKWQAYEDHTAAAGVGGGAASRRLEYDSEASLPTRPLGFAEALTAADGR